MSIGLTLPFAVSTGSLGYFAVTENELDAVKQNLRSLLLTNWGERPMYFYIGCNLREFLFEQERADELKEKIADRINDQVAKWMPFVIIDQLHIIFADEDPEQVPENGMKIRIWFRITSKPSAVPELVDQNIS